MKSINLKLLLPGLFNTKTREFTKGLFTSLIIILALQFNSVSYAKNDDPTQNVEGIYTGFLLDSGVPTISMTFNLHQNGSVTEISEGMITDVLPETTGTGSWRKSPKGGIEIVEVIYMSGRFCPVIGQNTCRVILGIQGKIDSNGLLKGKATNLTIKGLHPNNVSLDISPFTNFTIEVQKQSFDDMLIAP